MKFAIIALLANVSAITLRYDWKDAAAASMCDDGNVERTAKEGGTFITREGAGSCQSFVQLNNPGAASYTGGRTSDNGDILRTVNISTQIGPNAYALSQNPGAASYTGGRTSDNGDILRTVNISTQIGPNAYALNQNPRIALNQNPGAASYTGGRTSDNGDILRTVNISTQIGPNAYALAAKKEQGDFYTDAVAATGCADGHLPRTIKSGGTTAHRPGEKDHGAGTCQNASGDQVLVQLNGDWTATAGAQTCKNGDLQRHAAPGGTSISNPPKTATCLDGSGDEIASLVQLEGDWTATAGAQTCKNGDLQRVYAPGGTAVSNPPKTASCLDESGDLIA